MDFYFLADRNLQGCPQPSLLNSVCKQTVVKIWKKIDLFRGVCVSKWAHPVLKGYFEDFLSPSSPPTKASNLFFSLAFGTTPAGLGWRAHAVLWTKPWVGRVQGKCLASTALSLCPHSSLLDIWWRTARFPCHHML